MAITPHDLLQYAESLLEESGEIQLRNAAGRAFYAACHSCLPLCDRLESGPDLREGTHSRIIRLLSDYHGPDDSITRRVRALGVMYKQARDLRSKADYEIESDFTEGEAETVLGTVKRIVERTAELSTVTLG